MQVISVQVVGQLLKTTGSTSDNMGASGAAGFELLVTSMRFSPYECVSSYFYASDHLPP